MKLQVFDVEHGACSLLTADNNARLMVDCGHNVSTGWKPGTHLLRQRISSLEMLAITNYDEDHASGAPDLLESVSVDWILRNTSVSPDVIKLLKTEDGMGSGIDRLCQALRGTHTAAAGPSNPLPVFAGAEVRVFWVDYPIFDDENNLSMVLFLKCHGRGVMFPGDLERKGFLELLRRDDFKQALRETNVYVASHHGRENGCCEETVPLLANVYYVVISDQGYQYETQKTLPFYDRIAKGGPFRSQTRKILTTRRDGSITFNFEPTGWTAG